jgi:hypothetical protein
MRRLLAITLLLAFGSPLVAPLFAATPDAQSALPACCRMHGAHHCIIGTVSRAPMLRPPACGNYPEAFIPVRIAVAHLAARRNSGAQTLVAAAVPSSTERVVSSRASSSNLNRGPPSLSA